ncbi:hypothetical protein [Paucibacter sp. M5-1]|uniref:hypothetical protein n=1 Tax=Paucibacter sp. M5-1 TaxID=3015998 RepID=UPI003F7F27F5
MVEEIPPEDQVSRHIDAPHKWKPAEQEFEEARLFEFPRDEPESVVWRHYAPSIAEIHQMGCQRQAEKRPAKPSYTYVGAITATAEAIRAIRVKGHGFQLEHAPEEGLWHAHVSYLKEPNAEFNRAHKLDLKEHLRKAFGPLESHSCTD